MKNHLTDKERKYLSRLKELPCSVCGQEGPSDAHHIRQRSQYLCVPLCKDCHQGYLNGIHGQKRMWDVMRMDELDALNKTIRRILG